MSDTLNPKPLAASKNTNVDADQGTPKSQLIKEWICAMEDNMKKRDIDAAVTLYCIRCKDFDPNEVVNCKANGCALWWCRTNKLNIND